MPTAKMAAMRTNGPGPRPTKVPWLPVHCHSAVSIGPPAWLRMSHSRNTRMPVAKALRTPCTAVGSPRMRATGRPRKMVAPAMAPSRTAMGWLMIPLYG